MPDSNGAKPKLEQKGTKSLGTSKPGYQQNQNSLRRNSIEQKCGGPKDTFGTESDCEYAKPSPKMKPAISKLIN
jgi:hypothetical protein